MSRRESVKKALGITVYPWSSDEETMNVDEPVEILPSTRRDESNPDSANRAGSNSSPPVVATRLNNSRSRIRPWPVSNRVRTFDITPSITDYEPPETQRVDLNCPVSSMRRMIAIKRISRLHRLLTSPMDSLVLSAAASMHLLSQRSRAILANYPQSMPQPGLSEPTPSSAQNIDDPGQNTVPVSVDDSDDADSYVFSPCRIHGNSNENGNVSDEDPLLNNVSLEPIVEVESGLENDAAAADNSSNQENSLVDAENEVDNNIANVPRRRQKKKRENGSDGLNEALGLKEFNLKLLRLLECPVCLEWMEPPLSQCGRGHLLCVRCRARLNVCPVCRTAFSSVRNRAMEAVAELVRYPCRHGCGQEKRLKRRASHEANCTWRLYRCPATPCVDNAAMPLVDLPQHFQSQHPTLVKRGPCHVLTVGLNEEQHENYMVMVAQQIFHLRLDVELRRGLIIYVAYIGPVARANNYTYKVTIQSQHNDRKLVYSRATHSDLECSSQNVRRKDCFHLPMEHALNYLRGKYRVSVPNSTLLKLTLEIKAHEPIAHQLEEPDT